MSWCLHARCCLALVLVTGFVAGGVSGGVAAGQELSVTRLQRDIAENSRRIDELAREIDDAGRRDQQLRTEIEATETRLATTRFFEDIVRGQIQERAAAIYVTGRAPTDPIANLRRLDDAAAARHYGNGIAQADAALVNRIVEIERGLDADIKQLNADRELRPKPARSARSQRKPRWKTSSVDSASCWPRSTSFRSWAPRS